MLAAVSAGTRCARHAVRAALLLAAGFFGGLALGVPIAFVLAFSALLYFLADPSLPMLVYSQQVLAGMDHFVLLAIPFFVLAGLRDGGQRHVVAADRAAAAHVRPRARRADLIIITATAFFSGVSGSKLADIAAVGGIVMPAVRRTQAGPERSRRAAGQHGGHGRDHPAVHQHDHPGLRRQHLDRRPVHRRSRAGRGSRCGAGRGGRLLRARDRSGRQAFEQRRPLLRLIGGAAGRLADGR